MTPTSLARQLMTDAKDLVALARTQQAGGRHLIALSKSGPAFDVPAEPAPLVTYDAVSVAILRSGYEHALTGARGTLTEAQRVYCQQLAELAWRRLDDAYYEDDRGDALGYVVDHFAVTRPEWSAAEIEEIAREAIAVYRAVEARTDPQTCQTVDGRGR